MSVKKYLDFIEKKHSYDASEAKPFWFTVFPKWLETKNNEINDFYVFLSFSDCHRALDMLCDIAPASKKCEAVEELIVFLRENGDDDSDIFLMAAAAEKPKPVHKPVKRRGAPKSHTLFHTDGRTAHGSRMELCEQTGLAPARVTDLTTKRRGYASGWALTRERAAQGPGKPGPRKKSGND